MDGGAWWAAVHGVAKSRTRLSDFTVTFHFPALEKEMATHSSVLGWRIPGTGQPHGLPSMRSHRVGHDWSDLAVAAAATAHEPGTSRCSSWVQKGRETRDQIANTHWIMEKAREFPKNIYFRFIDYTKAFDCVYHNKLWEILKENTRPPYLLLRNL